MDKNTYRAALALGVLGSIGIAALAFYLSRGVKQFCFITSVAPYGLGVECSIPLGDVMALEKAQAPIFFGPAMSQNAYEKLTAPVFTEKSGVDAFYFFAKERRAPR